jgi:hypothetical protein
MSNSTALYYGPDEDATTIFLERTIVSSNVIGGLGYGAVTLKFSTLTHFS